jgi:hypothetical protein
MALRAMHQAPVVTPAVAALLHQLQQEAAQAAAPAPGTVVLQPIAGPLQLSSTCDGSYISAYDQDFNHTFTAIQSHTRPRQAKWSGTEVRRDDAGRRWERNFIAVADDFGDLVEVAA